MNPSVVQQQPTSSSPSQHISRQHSFSKQQHSIGRQPSTGRSRSNGRGQEAAVTGYCYGEWRHACRLLIGPLQMQPRSSLSCTRCICRARCTVQVCAEAKTATCACTWLCPAGPDGALYPTYASEQEVGRHRAASNSYQ